MNSLSAMCLFELRRTMTAGRIVWWFVLAAFPVAIVTLIRFFSEIDFYRATLQELFSMWSIVLYVLLPCMVSTLGVFLSAAPSIASELEQRSWVYLATRPNGVFWLLTGKYLVAIVWGFSAAVVGMTFAVPLTGAPNLMTLWYSMFALCLLSSAAYAAVYLLIGVAFPQRAMVFCVAYTAAVEFAISFIPAVINRVTVQYRLRSLFLGWTHPDIQTQIDNPFFDAIAGGESSVLEVFWLLALTVAFFVSAVVLAHRKEFTAAAESDV